MNRALLPLFVLLPGCTPAAPPPEEVVSACQEQRFEGSAFIVCDPGSGEIRLFAAAPGRLPLRRFADLPVDPARVAFAMNAGMFDGEGRPIGLAIADYGEVHSINLRDGGGNFHLKPNGIFKVTNGKPSVVIASSAPPVQYPFPHQVSLATQSGPMLVIGGKLHPRIAPDGSSHYVRNGVGVREGKALFVIGVDAVSLGKFARFFRDALKTPNALYLDGSVSSLWDPADGRMDDFTKLGPMIVAFKPVAASAPGREARATP